MSEEKIPEECFLLDHITTHTELYPNGLKISSTTSQRKLSTFQNLDFFLFMKRIHKTQLRPVLHS